MLLALNMHPHIVITKLDIELPSVVQGASAGEGITIEAKVFTVENSDLKQEFTD